MLIEQRAIKTVSRFLVLSLAATVLTTSCGREGPDAPPDMTPDAINFTAQTNVTPNTVVTSNSITVNGINIAAQISIAGGDYSVDGGAYTSAIGTVANGQTVTVQQTSSPNFGTTTNAVLTIGGISGIFSVTTIIATTTTTISALPVQHGADGIVTVIVSSAEGIPGGIVLLSVDGQTPTMQTLSNGSTTFTILKPSVGNHTLNAMYLAQGDFLGSSAIGTLVVH